MFKFYSAMITVLAFGFLVGFLFGVAQVQDSNIRWCQKVINDQVDGKYKTWALMW